MGSGYKVSHPALDCTYNVVLEPEQVDQVRNELSEMGSGGKVERLSDLANCIPFDDLLEEIREHY